MSSPAEAQKDWMEKLKEKMLASLPYAFSPDNSKAPVNQEEFDEAWEFLCCEVESLMMKSFQRGHFEGALMAYAQLEDIIPDDKKDSIILDPGIDRHFSEKKWQMLKREIDKRVEDVNLDPEVIADA